MAEDIRRCTVLHQVAQVHNADRIRNMLNNRKIVGDEQVGQVIFILQFFQQIDDLGLNGAA